MTDHIIHIKKATIYPHILFETVFRPLLFIAVTKNLQKTYKKLHYDSNITVILFKNPTEHINKHNWQQLHVSYFLFDFFCKVAYS